MLPYSEWERLGAGGPSSCRRRGIVEALRAVKDDEELAKIRKAARDRRPRLRGADGRDVGRPQRARDRVAAARAAARPRRRRVSFDSIVASGANGALPHALRPTGSSSARRSSTVDWGVRVDGYCSDCTRTFSTGGLPDTLRRGLRGRASPRRSAPSTASRPGMTGVEADALAREPIEAAGFGEQLRPRARPRRRARGPRGAAALDRVDGHARAGQVVTIEPGSTSRASAACESRISPSSARTASRC